MVLEPTLYIVGLTSPPGHEMFGERRIYVFKKLKKSVLSPITFYLEDDDHKAVDFSGETISFICHLINNTLNNKINELK